MQSERELVNNYRKPIDITIIDSVMGSGKSSLFIDKLNKEKDNKFIYITPFLSEVERVNKEAPRMRMPNMYNRSKFNHFKQLLENGEDIVSTHSMLSRFDLEVQSYIAVNEYTLILDEITECVSPYKFTSKSDEKTFYEYFGGVDEDGYLYWNTEVNPPQDYDGRFKKEMTLCLNRNLIRLNNSLYLWELPVEIFSVFKKVYILTYMFEGSIQKSYFDLYNVNYEYKSIKEGKIVEFKPTTKEDKSEWKNNITILEDDKLNKIGDLKYSLSSSWYKEMIKEKGKETIHLKMLKDNTYNFFTNKAKSTSKFNLWSTFKPYQNKLKGKGYTKGYLPYNTRATNDYREKYALSYLVNIFPHVDISRYFSKKGVKVKSDLYALSILIQWIWRSRIRELNSFKEDSLEKGTDKDTHIIIYIPSFRMRELLKLWLNNDDDKIVK